MIRCFLFLVSSFSFSLSIFAVEIPSAEILRVLAPYKKSVGFSLRSSSGKELLEIQGESLYSPASVAKMISTACVMRTLGPSFQFETVFGYRGSISGGVLTGDLVIKGGLDPSFVVEDFKEAIERVYVLYGIKEVKGSLIFETSALVEPTLEIAEGFDGDSERAFHSKLSAFPLNFNSFAVWIADVAGTARVEILPKGSSNLKVVNQVSIGSGGDTTGVSYDSGDSKVVVSGKFPRGAEPKGIYRSLKDPYLSAATLFGRIYSDLGGKWSAQKFQTTELSSFTKLFTYKTRPLSRILIDINKLSTNFGAEQVLLAAGADFKGGSASPEKSKAVLSDCLKNYGISETMMNLENASGLSRTSKISSSALTQFLVKLQKEDFYPEYLSTLAVLGRDGTVKKRLPSYVGQGRFKTGTLNGVRSISGFLFPKKGESMVVSMLFNCSSCGDDRIRAAEDQIIKILLDAGK